METSTGRGSRPSNRDFFAGFELLPSGVKLATPEKALVDVFYLSSTRVRLFSALPELMLPPGFKRREARRWVERIPNARLRVVAGRRLEEVLSGRRGVARGVLW